MSKRSEQRKRERQNQFLETVRRVLDGEFEEKQKTSMKWTVSPDGAWTLVGNGLRTNEFCGQFLRVKGCLNVDLHGQMGLDGECHVGEIYYKLVHNWCHRATCPVCFYFGWAVRQAKEIDLRLSEAKKRFGKVEHIVMSVPVKDLHLDYAVLRRKAVKIAKSRGIIGGSLIFHGFRYNQIKHWYWSPHFHVLGFIFGGYYRCRNCKRKWNCLAGCGGFDDRSYKMFLKDGWYVRVADPTHERKSVFHTAKYELGHASVKVGVKRFRVATYFGVCSYRKLKISAEVRKAWDDCFKSVCPICRYDLVNILYAGVKPFVTDINSPDYKHRGFAPYLENGLPAWLIEERGSVSYAYS